MILMMLLMLFYLYFKYGENGQVYNVVNEKNTMRIKEMAELVAQRIAGGALRGLHMILLQRINTDMLPIRGFACPEKN